MILKKAIENLLHLGNTKVLAKLERSLAPDASEKFTAVPCFIIGAPRSGSTVISQTLTTVFTTAYFSNLSNRLYGYPGLVKSRSRKRSIVDSEQLISDFGRTPGLSGISEGGVWWYRFFKYSIDNIAELKTFDALGFRRSLLAMTKGEHGLIVFKNLFASTRIQEISSSIPEAIYIVVKRDPLANCESIMNGRVSNLNEPYEDWWSVPVNGYLEALEWSATRQVVWQYFKIYEEITASFSLLISIGHLKKQQIHYIDYDEFCNDPTHELEKVERFYRQNKVQLDSVKIPSELKHLKKRGKYIKSQFTDELAEFISEETNQRESSFD